jgi:hypothetical protein
MLGLERVEPNINKVKRTRINVSRIKCKRGDWMNSLVLAFLY